MSGIGRLVNTLRQPFGVGFLILAGLLFFATTTLPARADKTSGPLLDQLPQATQGELRLVMVAIDGCLFCMRWEQQVGHIYPKSSEAKVAPLVRVRFGSETLARFKKIKYTPTFLVLRGANEIGRIAGYPGADPFWEELGIILKQNDAQPVSLKKDQP